MSRDADPLQNDTNGQRFDANTELTMVERTTVTPVAAQAQGETWFGFHLVLEGFRGELPATVSTALSVRAFFELLEAAVGATQEYERLLGAIWPNITQPEA